MESFYDSLIHWQPFFTAVAGVAATLAGLLFVSLSINYNKITAQQNQSWLRVADRSFGDLIYALFIALMFLIPAHNAYSLGLPLSILAAFRAYHLVRSLLRFSKSNRQNPAASGGFQEYTFQILTFLGLVATCIEIYRSSILITFYLVPVIAMLLYNGCVNAWRLLTIERFTDERTNRQ